MGRWIVEKRKHPDEAWQVLPSIAAAIREARIKMGLSISELAVMAKTHNYCIDGLECARQISMPFETAVRVAEALGIDQSWYIKQKERKSKYYKAMLHPEFIGIYEGTMEEALQYGRENCDLNCGAICIRLEDSHPSDLTQWADRTLSERYSAGGQDLNRKRINADSYSIRSANRKSFEHQIEIRKGE